MRLPAAVLLMGSLLAPPAWAQFAKPEEAVDYRQAALTLMGNHMKRIKSQLDASRPNLDLIRDSAALVNTLKALPFEAFPPGSGKAGDTAARPEIWTDREHFDRLAREMQAAAGRLDAAARAGSIVAIRTAFGETGKACKNCHEDFKKKR